MEEGHATAPAAGETRTGTKPSGRRRLPGVEGLRAIAAASVLIGHVYPTAAPADAAGSEWLRLHMVPLTSVGLTLFFTLSGYLLYGPFVAAALDGRPLDVRAYLRRRALRILPGYWVALLGTGLVLTALVQVGSREAGGLGSAWDLARWLTFAYQFQPESAFTGVVVGWSLAVEICFYLSLPVFGVLVLRWARGTTGRRRWAGMAAPALALLVVGAVATALLGPGATGTERLGANWFDLGSSWHDVVGRSFPVLGALFAGGMLLAVAHEALRRGGREVGRAWAAGAVLVSVACLVVGDRLLVRGVDYHAYQLLMMVPCTLVLALVVLPRRRAVLARVLDHPVPFFLGQVSYGIFLWHIGVYAILARHDLALQARAGGWATVLLVLVVSTAVAALSWVLVERPAIRRGRRRDRPSPAPVPALAVLPEERLGAQPAPGVIR